MPLRSKHFTQPRRLERLEAALTADAARIMLKSPRDKGEHVSKIQAALFLLMNNVNLGNELSTEEYGPLTAAAVLRYKQNRKPPIINKAYQKVADNIVGKMTMQALDDDMAKLESGVDPVPVHPIPPTFTAPNDWFVTEASLSSLSAVVGLGFTAITGTIKFEKPNVTSINPSIGMVGPSVGLSFLPNLGKMLEKIPGLSAALSRFPALKQFLMPSAVPGFSNDLLKFMISSNSRLVRLFFDHPVTKAALTKVITGLNGGLAEWWSTAIGMVFGRAGRTVEAKDFSGPCLCYSVGGAVGPGNFGFFVLFFGLSKSSLSVFADDPLAIVDLARIESQSKGFAVFSSASVAASIPGLGAGATIFFGEVV
jgi:peptidoglycan hydrolase-like protein with peptidoglycan-binding domain